MKNVLKPLVKIVLKLLGLKVAATYGGIHEKSYWLWNLYFMNDNTNNIRKENAIHHENK